MIQKIAQTPMAPTAPAIQPNPQAAATAQQANVARQAMLQGQQPKPTMKPPDPLAGSSRSIPGPLGKDVTQMKLASVPAFINWLWSFKKGP